MSEKEQIHEHITSLFIIELMIKEGASTEEILEFIEQKDHELCMLMDA